MKLGGYVEYDHAMTNLKWRHDVIIIFLLLIFEYLVFSSN